MDRIRLLLVLAAAILVVGAVACSGSSDDSGDAGDVGSTSTEVSRPASPGDPDRADPTTDPSTTTESDDPTNGSGSSSSGGSGITVGEPTPGFSPVNLPEREVTFRANTPANTPENTPVYLSIVDLTGGVASHIRMKNIGDGVYEARASVQAEAMIRYTYDRFDGEGCCGAYVSREAIGDLFEMQYRFLLVEPGLGRVNDTIATWADLRAPHAEGVVMGRVTDADSAEPIFDADVSISGIHVGTRTDGSFRVVGLPAGEHTVVIHSDSGDFLPIQRVVTLTGNATENVFLSVVPTKLVPVTFKAYLPDNTPDGSWVKLGGNIHSLGARIANPARPLTPDNFFIPLIEREGSIASAEFMLPEGAFIEYFYTIGPIGVVGDMAEQGRWIYRSFIVANNGDERIDLVKFWGNEGWPLVRLKLVPPEGTPANTPIALNMGPSSWMEPEPDGTYSTVIGSYPPGGIISYRYLLGDDHKGMDASDAADERGFRTLVVPEKDSVVTETVTRWAGQPDPSKRRSDGSLAVTFRVSVPPETPVGSQIFISGNRPALGDGIEMLSMDTNPWIYEAEVIFGHDGPLHYKYELRSEYSESFGLAVETDFDGQVVNDWVESWPGLSRAVAGRGGFMRGYYTPDLFSLSFIAPSESTYNQILDHEGSLVVVSSVWSYGQTQPTPTLEYRAVRAGSVATPLEEAIEQARIAHDAGLEVFFSPQFNMEQAPGGFELYNGPKTDEWWTEWLKLADEMWTWQATVAEMIDAQYMMVPGPLFHVYEHIDKAADDPFIVSFEAEQSRLIAKIRSIYSGKLVITGGNKNYDFPGLADYNGVTTYDIGVPQLPAETTVAEFIDYYEAQFVERVDPIYEKWGNPVLFYTIHAPSLPTAGDPSGEVAQANAIEAIFQVIARRPFINGSLS